MKAKQMQNIKAINPSSKAMKIKGKISLCPVKFQVCPQEKINKIIEDSKK